MVRSFSQFWKRRRPKQERKETPDVPEEWNLMNEEERNRFIAAKLNEGLSLAEVQRVLAEEHDVKMTYFDLRMLVSELDVDWQKQDERKEEETGPKVVEPEPEKPAGTTSVTVDKVVQPGASISGEVTFKSGAEAQWFVDNLGRLGLNPKEGSAKPTEEDIREFQMELQRKLGG